MLDHGLELVACSLKLRQSYLLPNGAVPEGQATLADAWSATIAYGALLHDIGKIAVGFGLRWVNLTSHQAENGHKLPVSKAPPRCSIPE